MFWRDDRRCESPSKVTWIPWNFHASPTHLRTAYNQAYLFHTFQSQLTKMKHTAKIRIKRGTKSNSQSSLESNLWHFVSNKVQVSVFNFGKFCIAQFTIFPTAASAVCHAFGIWTKPKHLLAQAAFLTGLGSIAYWLWAQALEPDCVSSDPASDTQSGYIFRKPLHSSASSSLGRPIFLLYSAHLNVSSRLYTLGT